MATDTRAFRAFLNREVHLGLDRATGDGVFVPLDLLKETSIHVVGASGTGKSYFLRHLISEFITHHQPFGLIDPHGDLYAFAVSALRRAAVRPDRVVLLDPSDDRFAVGFNPLRVVDDPSEAASLVLEACLKAWHAASYDETPRLERTLRSTFHLLAENGLTILESYDLLNVDNSELRSALRTRLSDPYVSQDWAEYEKLSRPEKLAVVESSRNRVRRFIQSPRIQRMIGQTNNVLDLKMVMDRGQFLVATLGGLAGSPESQRLLGAMLFNAFYHAAKNRDPRRRQDYFLVVDECGQFTTQDVADSLDELRKFGLHLVLAHQRLRQLERDDADVLSSILTNAKIRVVFGGLERLECERLSRELFTGAVNGNEVKYIATATKFRPVFDTFEVLGESWADSESEGESAGFSESGSDSTQETEGATYEAENEFGGIPYAEEDRNGRSRSANRSTSQSRSISSSRSSQRSASRGGSRSIVPITRHEKFVEETSRQYYGIDEQWERRIAMVHQLRKREALVQIFHEPVIQLRTPDVEGDRSDRATAQFCDRSLQRCGYAQPAAAVIREIEARKDRVRRLVEGSEARRPIDVKSFRE